MTGVSSRAMAKIMGVTHPAVLKAAKEKRIPRNADGSFDPEAVQRAWDGNTDMRRQRLSRGNGKGGESASTTLANLQRARLAKAHFEAREQKVRTEQIEGLVVRRDEVEKEVFELTRRIRDRLLAMPDRLGPMLAGITDVKLGIKLMRDEIRIILEELSGGKHIK
jgi:hypothetical protein